jgi:hypothetical protein
MESRKAGYKLQTNLNLTNTALADYMNSDGHTAPMEELEKRKLNQTLSRSMEGLFTINELTFAVMHTMTGDSSPGCDGFTVKHLREFWYDLQHITQEALNASFGNTLTSSLCSPSSSYSAKARRIPPSQATISLSLSSLSSTN